MEYVTKVLVPRYPDSVNKNVKIEMLLDIIKPDSKLEYGQINYITPFGRKTSEEYFIATFLNSNEGLEYISRSLDFDIFDIDVLERMVKI